MGSRGVKAAAPLALALSMVLSAVSAQASEPGTIRVANYNIHAGIGVDEKLDLSRTAAAIRASDADVVGLQEVDVHWAARSEYADQARELAARTGMRPFFAPIYDEPPEQGHAEQRQYGVLLLSKFPVLDVENHEITRLPTTEPDPIPRSMPGFAEAVLSVRGKPVHVYTNHLDYREDSELRRIQVAETMRIIAEDQPNARQVLVGDFNAEPNAPELGPLFDSMTDSWKHVHGSDGGETYPAGAPTSRIDYVTTSTSLNPISASTLPTDASDHRLVVSEIRL